MESEFEKMMFGGGEKANTHATPSFLADDSGDVPDFLRPSVPSSNANTAGMPSFLDGLGGGGGAAGSAATLAAAPAATAGVSSVEYLDMVGETGYRWQLDREKILGKGTFGCATLYRNRNANPATHSGVHRVVVKDINLQTLNNREEEMGSLRTEVAVLRQVRGHPSLVQFLDYHDGSGGALLGAAGPTTSNSRTSPTPASATTPLMVYIVLEFCGGGDLGNVIESAQQRGQAHVPEDYVASMLIQLMCGLHHLHMDCHVLHRDVKPQNVFLLEDGITARLGDFGIATVVGQVGAKAKDACGSPFYMAPELCEERAYDGGADVWSAGVMLYELMALERPFNANTIGALTQLVVKGRCTALADRRELSVYSKALKELVQSLLTVNAAARPTVRRVLRSSYVKQHLHTVPAAVLNTPAYRQVFGDAEVEAALPSCQHAGTPMDPIAVPASSARKASLPQPDYEDDFED